VDHLIQLTKEDGIQQRCRDVATELFSLDRGVAQYDAIYRNLTAAPRDEAHQT